MARLVFKPWEPEETVGSLWHAFLERDQDASRGDGVGLDEMSGRLAILFRGLGGSGAVEVKPALPPSRQPRRTRGEGASGVRSPVSQAAFDGETLRLPPRIDWSPRRAVNEGFYLWMAACCALSPPPESPSDDPLRADIRRLRRAARLTAVTLEACPGLTALHRELAAACLAMRPPAARLPSREAAMEAVVRSLLDPSRPPDGPLAQHYAALVGDDAAPLDALSAPRGYRGFLAPPLWPERSAPPPRQAPSGQDGPQEEEGAALAEKPGRFRGRRRRADQAERKDSLILHRFESILSWAELLNLNRRVEDDDVEAAKKAADDHDHLSLTRNAGAAKTRLKLHLDLAPEDVDHERLSGAELYPEWDHRRGGYWPEHCRVLTSRLEAAGPASASMTGAAARRRIRAVKRQFEALRPRRVILPRQTEGDDLDIDAAVRARVDFRSSGEISDRVYRATRTAARDLSVAILFDSSRSTESVVGTRSVIEVAREALIAFAWGLEACGDDAAIYAFSSLKRDRVYVQSCKAFDEAMGEEVEARIGALRPRFYTRLGAAVRHVSKQLQSRSRSRRLLLILTDGKPNDLDHYEGRYGVEDSRKAIQEARRLGQSVFAVTIDSKSRDLFGRIFGPGGFAVVARPDGLAAALPRLYRHLVQV